MKEIRPSYYKNRRGHDLFWKMETRGYPYQWCLGFCQINADKYERRAAWNGRQRVKPIKRTRKRQIARARHMMAEHDHTCYEWSQWWPTPARKPKRWKR